MSGFVRYASGRPGYNGQTGPRRTGASGRRWRPGKMGKAPGELPPAGRRRALRMQCCNGLAPRLAAPAAAPRYRSSATTCWAEPSQSMMGCGKSISRTVAAAASPTTSDVPGGSAAVVAERSVRYMRRTMP